ncbi:MAG: hypothetical protein EYC70_05875 [Planctomycetota bacterium]|nr:MAG: hypothetical protein EYC70_05875 [Planctomycetota bacterium]
MLRDAVRALLAGLAGAGLLALVDGLLQLAFPGRGYMRELATIALAGAWLVTAALVLLLCAAAALLRRPLQRPGTAFWLGWAVALAPITWSVLGAMAPGSRPAPPLVAIPSLLVAAAAPWLGRKLAPGRLAGPIVALGAAMLLAAPFLNPTGYEGRNPPPYRPRAGALQAPGGPDVILISIDTLRADAVLGERSADVPHLDALRASGFYAGYALSSSNQTLPGHVTMLTGLDAMEHGIRSNTDAPRGNLRLLSEYFQDAGYATAGVISNGLLSRYLGFQRGYDVYDDGLVRWSMASRALGYAADRNTWLGWLLSYPRLAGVMRLTLLRALLEGRKGSGTGEPVTTRALARIGELAAQPRPYFLFAHLMDAHMPYPRPEAFRGRYSQDLPRPGPAYLPPDDRAIQQPYLRRAQADLQAGVPAARVTVDYYHAVYREVVAYVDDCVGRIVAAARATGRPTVVLFTADHGEHFGEHELFEHANSLYEPLLRVPLIVGFLSWQGEPPVRGNIGDAVALSDVAPTLLHLAGLGAEGMTGLPAYLRSDMPVQLATDDRRISARYGPWKWIGTWNATGAPESLALYNLEQDPGELHNLLEQGAEPPAELRVAIADAIQRDTHAQNLGSSSAEQNAALAEMGYADAVPPELMTPEQE